MKQCVSSTVDVRSFRWPLATLERCRSLAVDEAALRLARAERERDASTGQLERAEAQENEQIEVLRKTTVMDPAVRSHALAYLRRTSTLRQEARDALAIAVRRADEARAELRRAHREFDLLASLRGTALTAFAVQEGRRRAKEADLAWLARMRGAEVQR